MALFALYSKNEKILNFIVLLFNIINFIITINSESKLKKIQSRQNYYGK